MDSEQDTKKYNINEILSSKKELTEKDILTLLVLMKHGRITNPKLLEKLNLMGANLSDPNSVAHHRKKLEKVGVIERYCARINWVKLGYPTEFVVIITADNKGTIFEIEKSHIAAVEEYREQTGANVLIIPINEEGDKIILRDVLYGGEKPISFIHGRATNDGAAMMYADFYLPKRFPKASITLLIIQRSSIKEFEFQDETIKSLRDMIFSEGEIDEYREKFKKEFRWDLFKPCKK